MKKQTNQRGPIPIRLEVEQQKMMEDYQTKTGLNKSFIIRRCVTYALEKFTNETVNILTLKDQ